MSDQFIAEFDKVLRTLFAGARGSAPSPGDAIPEMVFSDVERSHVVGLMRINHCGEICAQALYQGQALTSGDAAVREALDQAAGEEAEHLAWTERRLAELGGRKSLLNPLWYAGALSMGMVAGRLGKKWNLGFLAETERQVEAHLEGHLAELPAGDRRSREILEQMKSDEVRHALTASRLGAAELPAPVKSAMRLAARFMTRAAYHV